MISRDQNSPAWIIPYWDRTLQESPRKKKKNFQKLKFMGGGRGFRGKEKSLSENTLPEK